VNLQNVENTPIASGIYVALIDAPGIGTKVFEKWLYLHHKREFNFKFNSRNSLSLINLES